MSLLCILLRLRFFICWITLPFDLKIGISKKSFGDLVVRNVHEQTVLKLQFMYVYFFNYGFLTCHKIMISMDQIIFIFFPIADLKIFSSCNVIQQVKPEKVAVSSASGLS